MKKISLILAVLIGVFAFFISCEKYDKVVLDMEDTIAPQLTNPADGGTYVLLKSEANNVFASFAWTEAVYNVEGLPQVKYIVQVDYADSLFKNARDLANTADLSADVTVTTLNQRLLALEAEPGQAKEFAFRVFSYISIDSEYTYAYSETITLTITPYADTVTANPIYLLGNATAAGWSNTAALELTPISGGLYGIVAALNGQYIKFISVLGQWAPQWGKDEGDANEGTLAYRPTEAVADPPAIDVSTLPPGEYYILADTAALTYKVTPSTMELYLMGTATEAGLNNTSALAMTKDGVGKFSITTELTSGGTLFFIEVLGENLPMFGTNAEGTAEEGKLVRRATAGDPEVIMIPAPAASGEYLIEVNLSKRTYTISAK
ncbi:MAG: SusE domain-containing protein [Bacteroidetes bacterium]|nr:SusE domain-containing protein [Bacteroidota bacterium]